MIFNLFLMLFLLTALFGLSILLIGLKGVFTSKTWMPNLRSQAGNHTIVAAYGAEARKWGLIEVGAALCLLVLAYVGLALYSDYRYSPDYIDSIIEPPQERTLLYFNRQAEYVEMAYTFDMDSDDVWSHYKNELHNCGWQIKSQKHAMLYAVDDDREIRITVIGKAPVDQKNYRCKVLIVFGTTGKTVGL